jgi:hypothetical protein
MAKVFIGIALVFMLATAGLGFVLKGNVDKLQSALTTAKGKITIAEGNARASKSDAEKAQKEAADANDKATASAAAATAKGKEADDAKTALAESKQLVDSLTTQKKDLEDKLAEAMKAGADPAKLAQKDTQIAELTTKMDTTNKELTEAKMAFESEVAKGKENEEKVRDLSKKLRDREVNYQKPGLQGRILAVNSGWNFVVLNVGDKQGVVINATLLVVRGNEPVARLRVTSVEPSTSIADVLPGTVRKGTAVQPGDTIIFEGTRNQSSPVPKSAPETTPIVPPITPATPALPNN